ncbi:limbic system-associated membrane protein-like [Anthonomus grandis grandis]|uniref:limbic system-associated membrane protein-like n=1 Tax=Anthonomus grandis grandis TaxID=2921223 RepID=UPI00216573FF|nr:limbic system-associated membrane protein-like [Anthonomus grandis grandis]
MGKIIILMLMLYIKDSSQANIKVDPSTLPTFLTSSQVFKVKDQDRVVLPCEVTNLGPYILAWKRGIAVLSAGSVKVSPDPRVQLINGFNLEIREVGPQDAGDYVCQIGTLEPREITHTLEVLVPPQITYVSSNGRVEVKKGTSVILECKAEGNPVPKITWSRKNNLLPGGDQTVITSVLSLDRVDRHHAGVYQCTASNGIGQEASKQIVLHVLYPPEISVENPIVHSAEGFEAQLVCIVHGENQPEVLWYRDTMQLDTTERRIMESRGSRHTLVIRKVHRTDFGNYTCVADNPLGKTRKSIQLTGIPKAATFKSSTTGNYKDSYNISWEVESLSPIEEYQLLFRKASSPFVSAGDDPQPLHHQGTQRKFGENRTYSAVGYSVGYGSSYPWSGKSFPDWRNVILPASRASSNNGVQTMSYVIRGLEPGKQYEAKVQARNKFGWSPVSSFLFQTTEKDSPFADVRHYYDKQSPSPIGNFFGISTSSSPTNYQLTMAALTTIALISLNS